MTPNIKVFKYQGSRLTIFTKSTVAPDWKFLGAQAENLGAHLESAYNAIVHICDPGPQNQS